MSLVQRRPLTTLLALTTCTVPMAPPQKTMPEQTTWLQDRIPAFRQAQKDAESGPWSLAMCQDWYAEWPIEDEIWGAGKWPPTPLSPEDKEMKEQACIAKQKQLINWFRNNTRNGAVKKLESAPARPKGKNKRALQEVEVYSKLYYDEKVKPVVEEKLASLKADRNVDSIEPKERLAIVRSHTMASLQQAGDDVKKAVAEAHAEEKERTRALAQAYKIGIVQEEGRTPEQYQHAIDSAPGDIRKALDPIAAASGCIYTVILSGPMPMDGGAVGSLSVHSGKTITGHNFAEVTPKYRDDFVRPHVRFAKGLYPIETRQERALPPAATGLYCLGEADMSAPRPSASMPSSQGATRAASRATSPVEHVIATPSVILDERDKHTGLGSWSLQEDMPAVDPTEGGKAGEHSEGAPAADLLLAGFDPVTGNAWPTPMTSTGTTMDMSGPVSVGNTSMQFNIFGDPLVTGYNMSGAEVSFGNQLTGYNMSGAEVSFGNQLTGYNMSGAEISFGN
ncbi:hypothetical protein K466DRAFT_570886, partial [Polyporus arcularius HHB13444]